MNTLIKRLLAGAIFLVMCIALAGCNLPKSAEETSSASSASASSASSESVAASSASSASSTSAASSASSAESVSAVSVSSAEEEEPLQAVSVATEAPTKKVYLSASDHFVRYRLGPDRSEKAPGILEPNSEIEVLEEMEGWYKISYDGGEYYVETDDLIVKEEKAEGEDGDSETPTGENVIVIDPGHQEKGNSEQEPIGPGATETKAKVTGGASGTVSGLTEYELNLRISQKLQAILTERGYEVIMTRETNDVDISNAERAEIANDANAAAFIRVHANSSANASAKGAMTICQTANNPYNGQLYAQSKALATEVLDKMVAASGCTKERVWETDTMSGINWCEVPATIVEVGYMSNPEEDKLLATDDYQQKLATGIADGIDAFLAA